MKTLFKILLLWGMLLSSNESSAQNSFEQENQRRFEKARIYEDSIGKAMEWKLTKNGLYISKFGDVAFKTAYIAGGELVTTYRKTMNCCDSNSKPLRDVIDTSTFKQIGGDWGWGGYFKDKNHIYHFFGNSGGGFLSIVDEADLKTFEIINDCYGRDKNHIYDMRFGLIKDINSGDFKILPKGDVCLAKYKGTYYQGNYPLDEKQLKEPEIKKAIKELDKYIEKTKHLNN